jgi:hypothetical protein
MTRQIKRLGLKRKILARVVTRVRQPALSVTSHRLGRRFSADIALVVYCLLAAKDPDFVLFSQRLRRFLAQGGSSISGP